MKRRRPEGELRGEELKGRLVGCLYMQMSLKKIRNTISRSLVSKHMINIKGRELARCFHFHFSVKESERNSNAVKQMSALYRYMAIFATFYVNYTV